VTVCIVEELEVVEVDDDDRERPGHLLGQAISRSRASKAAGG
jgi:hypothetical protein